jgi:hypothetical protein
LKARDICTSALRELYRKLNNISSQFAIIMQNQQALQ